jgi:hypothetical protein
MSLPSKQGQQISPLEIQVMESGQLELALRLVPLPS